jgi:hypothetical protein
MPVRGKGHRYRAVARKKAQPAKEPLFYNAETGYVEDVTEGGTKPAGKEE